MGFFICCWTLPAQELMDDALAIADTRPPQVVLDKFHDEYREVTPKWTREGSLFRAEFVDPNTLKGACMVYDHDGKVVRRETEMGNNTYPAGILQYFIKKYPGEKFKTWSSLDNSGSRKYYICRDKTKVWFDHDGKFIEER